MDDRRESGRAEAFSDGVIAFAITLLVLNLKDPLLDPYLAGPIPYVIAFALSFVNGFLSVVAMLF
ncbi:MAG TPA: TMEM175 family protein, partial [Candidatus Bathyarchaeia archaeon]|nr:TMEM175 family protein [Candidatus Bathyarchaeia archaeon]